jgi:hypothetical protein
MMQNGWVRPGVPGMGRLSSDSFSEVGRSFFVLWQRELGWQYFPSVGDKNSIQEPRKGT